MYMIKNRAGFLENLSMDQRSPRRNPMETKFSAPGISCEGCAGTIKKALGAVPHVSGVDVDVDAKTVTVAHDDAVGRDALADALAHAGYPAAGRLSLPVLPMWPGSSSSAKVKDPVCGMDVDPANAAATSEHA